MSTMAKTKPYDVVLVTGGSGFVGQHIVKLLQEKDKDVKEIRVFDRVPYTDKLGKILLLMGDSKPLFCVIKLIKFA